MKNQSQLSFFSLCIVFSLFNSQFSWAHGTVTSPPSRVYICYLENPESPDSPACAAAVEAFGTQQFYDYNGVNQGSANGDHESVVADGNLASGGNPVTFGGLDLVRDDWVTTNVEAGPMTVTWTNSAPHATLYYKVYITTDDWDPTMPLSWDKLELLATTDYSPAQPYVNIAVDLPNRTGHHVIYSVWQRSDSQEAFYSASDVKFGDNPPPPPPVASEKVIIESESPILTFQTGTEEKYDLGYSNEGDKFIIGEVGANNSIEIKDGNIYFPNHGGQITKYLLVNADGMLVDEIKPPFILNKYDFPFNQSGSGFQTTRKGLHFPDGKVIGGIRAHLLDNDAGNGQGDNSITVSIFRQSKTSNTIPEEIVFEITSDNTDTGVFEIIDITTPTNTGYNVIDNSNYIYSIEVRYCNDCEFREIVILE